MSPGQVDLRQHHSEIAGSVLLMYGGRSDSKAVTLALERLVAVLPHAVTKEFPILDHCGIERTAPREVAKAVSDYFLRLALSLSNPRDCGDRQR